MACLHHPETSLTERCAVCEESFCADCLVEILGQRTCGPCRDARVRELETGKPADARARAFRAFALLIGAGWLGTNLGYSIADLPLRFVLMDQLKLDAAAVSAFFAISQFTNYIKPLAGILTDAIPLFGTRRRHYLLGSLTACGLMWIILSLVPATYAWLLGTYTFLHIFIVLISTVLGGVMVEGGARYQATGRLSAQRVGIFRVVGLVGGPLGGWLSNRPFPLTASITAALHFILVPLFSRHLREEATAQTDTGKLEEVKRQARVLVRSRTLWSAAGLVILVTAAPGFGTPLLFYQRQVLGFEKQFIGNLGLISGAFGVLGAYLYSRICGRLPLRPLVALGILTHVFAALLYLGYRTPLSAIVITGLYQAAQCLALLPLYDLAMRATPRGSEALGYSVMMSVWNLTNALSDLLGSWLIDHWHISFTALILINSGTTALVLLAVPLLPASLMNRREGESA
jgi:predicted MFS family arabinose efflux permease